MGHLLMGHLLIKQRADHVDHAKIKMKITNRLVKGQASAHVFTMIVDFQWATIINIFVASQKLEGLRAEIIAKNVGCLKVFAMNTLTF
jgi:hypothetical protein